MFITSSKGVEEFSFRDERYTNPSGDTPTPEGYLNDPQGKADPSRHYITSPERRQVENDFLYTSQGIDPERLETGHSETHVYNSNKSQRDKDTRIKEVKGLLRLDELNTEEQQCIDELLARHFDLFQFPGDLLECTNKTAHAIVTTDSVPVHTK